MASLNRCLELLLLMSVDRIFSAIEGDDVCYTLVSVMCEYMRNSCIFIVRVVRSDNYFILSKQDGHFVNI